MSDNNHLYLYQRVDAESGHPYLYIGIGDYTRPYGGHNADAEALRDHPATEVLVTPEPFSSREDARRAEALMIHLASLTGATLISDEETSPHLTNRAGVKSTGHLVPALYRRDGTVDFHDLRECAIVPITPQSIDTRPTMHAGRTVSEFEKRAIGYWNLGTARRNRYPLRRLLAVSVNVGMNVILGDWDLADDPIADDGRSFRLKNPGCDDPRSVKGMTLVNKRMNMTQTYSADVLG